MTTVRPGLFTRFFTRLTQVLGGRRAAGHGSPPRAALALHERFQIARDDLLREYTREEIEQHERATDPLGGVAPVPFGHLNPVWQRFCAALAPGDRIWRFNAQRVAANGEAVIRSGYVAVRQGVPQRPMVATFRTVGADAPLARLAASTEPVTVDLLGPPRPSVGRDIGRDISRDAGREDSSEAGRAFDVAMAAGKGEQPVPAALEAPLASANQTDGGTNAANAHHPEPATVE